MTDSRLSFEQQLAELKRDLHLLETGTKRQDNEEKIQELKQKIANLEEKIKHAEGQEKAVSHQADASFAKFKDEAMAHSQKLQTALASSPTGTELEGKTEDKK